MIPAFTTSSPLGIPSQILKKKGRPLFWGFIAGKIIYKLGISQPRFDDTGGKCGFSLLKHRLIIPHTLGNLGILTTCWDAPSRSFVLNPTWDTPRKCKTTEPLRLWSPPLERTFPASKAIHDTTRTPASPQASWSYTHLSRVWAETLPWKQQRNVDMSMSQTGKPSQNADQIYIRTCRNIMKYPLLAT